MNAAQTAATFEIQTTPVLACDDPLCMSCAGDGICGAARKPIPEIERESAAGEARLAEIEAEYDASRSTSARVPQDGPVVSSLTREGAAALADALVWLLWDESDRDAAADAVIDEVLAEERAARQIVLPPVPPLPRHRVKRCPRPAVPTPAGKPAAPPALNAHQRQVLVWLAIQRHQRMTYTQLGEWVISSEGRLLGTTRSSTVRALEARGMIQRLHGEAERRYITEAGLRVAQSQTAEAA